MISQEDRRKQMVEMKQAGLTYVEIAKQFHITSARVREIVLNEERKTAFAKRKVHEETLVVTFTSPLERLDLSARTLNVLRRYNIVTVNDALDFLERGPNAYWALRGFGTGSLVELIACLHDKNLLRFER